ncbi:type II secretion system F family protein [Luteimicrobium subarcticum]|uniref:Tight adherence protein B n=1 Tax=Luteimicrobium subarcticum TaxID=620910 RepID=A0A2M8WSE6_9MICO|nr:hypothetical protein [Luteimicrobium subarcticum]PJI93872.1 tight adherence protein B [Luteimicrobium subarcticum]
MLTDVVVGVLVGLAAATAACRGAPLGGCSARRRARALDPRSGRGTGGRGTGRRRRAGAEAAPAPVLVAQVAALLRSGAPPGEAWRAVASVPCDATGVPDPGALARRLSGRGAADGTRAAWGVVAAVRLAVDLGAPLADVLDDVGAALAVAHEVRAEQEAALAGPRASARVLLWLPLAGVGLGYALGVDPVAFLLGGPAGWATVVLAALLVEAGRRWTGALVRTVRTDAERGAR